MLSWVPGSPTDDAIVMKMLESSDDLQRPLPHAVLQPTNPVICLGWEEPSLDL